MDAMFGHSLQHHGIGWVQCSNGITWKLNLADSTHRWIIYGMYEGGLGIEWAMKALCNGGVFVDSGANIGQWLLYLGSISGLATFEFEPVDSQREWLQECINAQAGWNCTILKSGLGSSSKEVDIQCDGARSTTSMNWYKGKNFRTQRISIRRLEDIMVHHGIDLIDFWKLDVEGAEYDALLGAGRYLADRLIKNIYFECRPSIYGEIKKLLEDSGYHLYELTRQGPRRITSETIRTMQDLVALPV